MRPVQESAFAEQEEWKKVSETLQAKCLMLQKENDELKVARAARLGAGV